MTTAQFDEPEPGLAGLGARAVAVVIDSLLVGFFVALSSPRKQRIGDRFAKTIVVSS